MVSGELFIVGIHCILSIESSIVVIQKSFRYAFVMLNIRIDTEFLHQRVQYKTMQSSVVITRSDVVKYYINYYKN